MSREPEPPLTAEDARRLTDEACCGPVIAEHVKKLDMAICMAAVQGKRSVIPTYIIKPDFSTATEIWAALKRHYIKQGFDWKYHQSDSHDPREISYHEVKW